MDMMIPAETARKLWGHDEAMMATLTGFCGTVFCDAELDDAMMEITPINLRWDLNPDVIISAKNDGSPIGQSVKVPMMPHTRLSKEVLMDAWASHEGELICR